MGGWGLGGSCQSSVHVGEGGLCDWLVSAPFLRKFFTYSPTPSELRKKERTSRLPVQCGPALPPYTLMDQKKPLKLKWKAKGMRWCPFLFDLVCF